MLFAAICHLVCHSKTPHGNQLVFCQCWQSCRLSLHEHHFHCQTESTMNACTMFPQLWTLVTGRWISKENTRSNVWRVADVPEGRAVPLSADLPWTAVRKAHTCPEIWLPTSLNKISRSTNDSGRAAEKYVKNKTACPVLL